MSFEKGGDSPSDLSREDSMSLNSECVEKVKKSLVVFGMHAHLLPISSWSALS